MHTTRLTRRTVLGGGLVLLTGCEGALAFDDSLLPVAHGQEEDAMPTPPAGLTQPLVLWGSVVAQPGTDAAVPNEQLANPFGLPMELLAIRFRIHPMGNAASAQVRTVGASVKVKLDLGNAGIASDCPLSILGTVRDTYEGNANIMADYASGVGVSYVQPATYDWRLKYPLFIPAGKVLSAVFTPMGLNSLPVNIDVAYICRTWDMSKPQPQRIKLPWAAAYESKTFDYNSNVVAASDASSTLDVLNPFQVPLELQRIGGRLSSLVLSVGGAPSFIYEDAVAARSLFSTLRMRSSRGFDLIRTPTQFDGIFPRNWRAWDVPEGWSMAPQEYYRVQVDMAAINTLVAANSIAQVQAAVGIVGYREVNVAGIGDAP